jgi:hypothetical protein
VVVSLVFGTSFTTGQYREFAVHHSRDSIAETTVKFDLVFHYKANPFAFWIPCRSASPTTPLFDTRVFSLPATPIGPVISAHTSMALHNFSSVFEDQYIHVSLYPFHSHI